MLIWRTPAGPADIIGGSLERKRCSHTTPTVHEAQMLVKLREQGTVRLVFPAWMGRVGGGGKGGEEGESAGFRMSLGCTRRGFLYVTLQTFELGDGFNVFIYLSIFRHL